MILGIALSFLLVAAAVLWFVIGSKGFVILKLAMIAACCSSSILLYNTLNSYKGWPSSEETPKKFMIKWVDIHEPSGQYKGDIFLWISKPPKHLLKGQPLPDEGSDKFLYYQGSEHEPRAYRIPYSKSMHNMMQKAQQALKKGKPVMIDKSGKSGESGKGKEGKGGKDGKGGKGIEGKEGKMGEISGSWNFSQKQKWEFHVLPPPKLPEKVFE